ncbi:hypothetical protein PoB_005329900 [Plakobranchus ocellatus]|uniref:Uncharacterized protein n=1 Tax=Plakobranchus ocellatus TaxID=259542 RepID=A0AAV4C2Q4_9GAST|nr:hypothetical protein PoB_005329900 [Plakobranchus ocellatus]
MFVRPNHCSTYSLRYADISGTRCSGDINFAFQNIQNESYQYKMHFAKTIGAVNMSLQMLLEKSKRADLRFLFPHWNVQIKKGQQNGKAMEDTRRIEYLYISKEHSNS